MRNILFPAFSNVVPGSPRHIETLDKTINHLETRRNGLAPNLYIEDVCAAVGPQRRTTDFVTSYVEMAQTGERGERAIRRAYSEIIAHAEIERLTEICGYPRLRIFVDSADSADSNLIPVFEYDSNKELLQPRDNLPRDKLDEGQFLADLNYQGKLHAFTAYRIKTPSKSSQERLAFYSLDRIFRIWRTEREPTQCISRRGP